WSARRGFHRSLRLPSRRMTIRLPAERGAITERSSSGLRRQTGIRHQLPWKLSQPAERLGNADLVLGTLRVFGLGFLLGRLFRAFFGLLLGLFFWGLGCIGLRRAFGLFLARELLDHEFFGLGELPVYEFGLGRALLAEHVALFAVLEVRLHLG